MGERESQLGQPSHPVELRTLSELEDFYRFFIKSRQWAFPQGVTSEQIVRGGQRLFQSTVEKDGKRSSYYGIKDGDKLVAIGRLSIMTGSDGIKKAHVGSIAVEREYQGKKYPDGSSDQKSLVQQLLEASWSRARVKNCAIMNAEVFSDTPDAVKSLNVAFKIGFILVAFKYLRERPGIDAPVPNGVGAFILEKNLQNDVMVQFNEKQRVKLDSIDKIQKALLEGWVGTKLLADKADGENYLVLEK